MPEKYRRFKERSRSSEEKANRPNELRRVLAQMRETIREHGITPEQLFDLSLASLVRFRDPVSGKTWNGSGRPPDWIRGKDHELFRVNSTRRHEGDPK